MELFVVRETVAALNKYVIDLHISLRIPTTVKLLRRAHYLVSLIFGEFLLIIRQSCTEIKYDFYLLKFRELLSN